VNVRKMNRDTRGVQGAPEAGKRRRRERETNRRLQKLVPKVCEAIYYIIYNTLLLLLLLYIVVGLSILDFCVVCMNCGFKSSVTVML
jgi:hypothetical protein